MLELTTPVRPRPARTARLTWLAVAASLVLAVGCSSQSGAERNPSISASVDRSKDGSLQGVTVTGSGFSANGPVLISALMAASGNDKSPYLEETIQADGSGKIKWEKKPIPCPQSDYGTGSWTRITARDTNSGISGSALLTPGGAPDCHS